MRDEQQQLVDQYEDLIISFLLDEYAEADGARLLQEYEKLDKDKELPIIPEALDEKCKKLINQSFAQQKRKLHMKRIGTFISKVAIVVLILLGLSTVTVLSVDAFRVPVLNFLMDQSGRYSTVVFENNANPDGIGEDSVVTRFEVNLPEGYRIIKHDITGMSDMITCSNEHGHMLYLEITKTDSGLTVDTEDQGFQKTDFHGYEAVFQDKNGYCLMWLDDNSQTVYTLYSSDLQIDLFWEFASTLVI